MKIYRCISIFLLACPILTTGQYHILVAVPVASKSLHYLFSSLIEVLLTKGHTVTYITSFDPVFEHEKLTIVRVIDSMAQFDVFEIGQWKQVQYTDMIDRFTKVAVDSLWNQKEILDLFKIRDSFDAIITPSYVNDVIMPFIDNYNGTFVMVATPGVDYFSLSRLGNWLPLSSVPHLFSPYNAKMTFMERSRNVFSTLVGAVTFQWYTCRRKTEMLRKYHPNLSLVNSYYSKNSLTLINGHFALDDPVPLLPNQVEIGTINAKLPKPLPKDLEDFMQSSGDDGVILFSLGSFANAKTMPQNIKDELVKAFRKIKQKIIWKYEGTDLDLPANVMTKSWLPQQDILGHEKTKIFMSHCGNLGTQEAKFHGVPVLAIPIFFDQPKNAARIERKGYGISIPFFEITQDKVLTAINKLLDDKSYKERIKEVSVILKDQKESPAERALWWIEYVIRHKGSTHLRYVGEKLYLFQYLCVDIFIFWTVVFSSLTYATYYLTKKICVLLFSSRKEKNE